MQTWTRATVETPCASSTCDRAVPRGEPLCLVTVGRHPMCSRCALQRFQTTPPADLGPLTVPAHPAISQGSQPWHRFDRTYAARTAREAIEATRRHDGRAKAAGE